MFIDTNTSLAYIADDGKGLIVLDIADPREPKLYQQFKPDTPLKDVIGYGKYIYGVNDAGLYVYKWT
jgi:hypothetical protein